MTTIRVDDSTPASTVADALEARTRRLMAERARLPEWGLGRLARREALRRIDDALDEWLAVRAPA